MRTIWMVGLCLSCTLAVSCSDDEDKSLGGVTADTPLGALSGAEEDRVCDALYVRQLEDRKDAAFVHGRCLMEAARQARWRSALDSPFTWLQACERIFDACVEVRDEHAVLAEACGNFDECPASVADLEHCADSASNAYVELSEHTCDELAEDEGDEVLGAISERVLDACSAIGECPAPDQPRADLDAGADDPYDDLFDEEPTHVPDPPDALSNAEWESRIDMSIASAERSACSGDAGIPAREAELDEVARAMAMDSGSTPAEVGFEPGVRTIWQQVQSASIVPTLELTEAFLDEEPLACLPRYGLGIAGEPGEQRNVILLLVDAE